MAETLGGFFVGWIWQEMGVMVFIKDLWRGDVRLVFTFWIIFFCGNWIFGGYNIFLDEMGYLDDPTVGEGISLLIIGAVSTLYFIFTVVCVWRSANKHKGRAVWAILAKAAVVIGVLRTVADWAKELGIV